MEVVLNVQEDALIVQMDTHAMPVMQDSTSSYNPVLNNVPQEHLNILMENVIPVFVLVELALVLKLINVTVVYQDLFTFIINA